MPERPFVAVAPYMRWGAPTIRNTQVSVEAVAGMVWAGESVDTVADEYRVSRADVLVACWYAGAHGLPGRRRSLAATPLWRKRWGVWAESVQDALWHAGTVDYDTIPGPPSKEET